MTCFSVFQSTPQYAWWGYAPVNLVFLHGSWCYALHLSRESRHLTICWITYDSRKRLFIIYLIFKRQNRGASVSVHPFWYTLTYTELTGWLQTVETDISRVTQVIHEFSSWGHHGVQNQGLWQHIKMSFVVEAFWLHQQTLKLARLLGAQKVSLLCSFILGVEWHLPKTQCPTSKPQDLRVWPYLETVLLTDVISTYEVILG